MRRIAALMTLALGLSGCTFMLGGAGAGIGYSVDRHDRATGTGAGAAIGAIIGGMIDIPLLRGLHNWTPTCL